MQVVWACSLLCLMSVSVCSGRWIFPDHNVHTSSSPVAMAPYTGSTSSSSSSSDLNSNSNGMKHSESSISLTSVFDPQHHHNNHNHHPPHHHHHDLDIDGFPKTNIKNSFSVNSALRRLRYGFKLPPGTDTTIYGLKVPRTPLLPPSPPAQPPLPSARPQPLVLAASSYSSTYSNNDYLSQPTNLEFNRVIRQYSPPLITAGDSFSPSMPYLDDEAFQPSTYFVQTELLSPTYSPPATSYKKAALAPSYQYPSITTTFKPVIYRDTFSPKRHATLPTSKYTTQQPYQYVLSQKYDTPAPLKYNTPAPYKYHTPEPYKHHTAAPYKHHTAAPYKHHTAAPYKHHTAAPYKHHTPEPYKYNAPALDKYNTPAPYKSYITSSYDVPKSDITETSYKHHKPKKYDYRYNVGSIYHGTAYRHQEKSDGATVHGEYRVRLPDGRLQVVTYTADHENGYVPTVRYEGPQTVQAADIHFQPPTPTKVW